jgi:hypothetical protein
MARPATPRRPAGRRTGRLDRPAPRPGPTNPGPTAAPDPGPGADGPHLPAVATHQATIAEVIPAACWALLPADERERLGRRLSQLVLKAVRPPVPVAEDRR